VAIANALRIEAVPRRASRSGEVPQAVYKTRSWFIRCQEHEWIKRLRDIACSII